MAHCKVNQLDMHGFCNRFDSICIKKNCRFFGVKTNADRIRAMSDEELAKFIGEEGFHCEICSKGVNSECDLRCSTYCLEWLKQPAEE